MGIDPALEPQPALSADPLVPRVADGVAPAGALEAPSFGHWAPGTVIHWHYRRPGTLSRDEPVLRQNVYPVRVVRDDERGLVSWLAPGTLGIAPVHAEGRPLARGAGVRFDYPWRLALRPWLGEGILRIAPAGMPWSVWLFWRAGWEFTGWYVNLEDAHLRDAAGVYTCDHVLDLVVEPTGECRRKDEDELLAAQEQGRFTGAQISAIEANAGIAEQQIAAGHWPLERRWCDWRPDPHWPAPSLPPELTENLER